MTTEQFMNEEQDRRSIRELVDQYAYCADSRNTQGQMALFTEDTQFLVYMDSRSDTPTQVITRKEDLFQVFDDLNKYNATMHFNGQCTISLKGNRATGITYCLAHHQASGEHGQQLMVASIRYHDVFLKQSGTWLFAERKLLVDWIENR